jgi:hypothetical protein
LLQFFFFFAPALPRSHKTDAGSIRVLVEDASNAMVPDATVSLNNAPPELRQGVKRHQTVTPLFHR